MAPRSARPISVRAWRCPSTSRSRRPADSSFPSPPFRGGEGGARAGGVGGWDGWRRALWNPPPHPNPLRPEGRRGSFSVGLRLRPFLPQPVAVTQEPVETDCRMGAFDLPGIEHRLDL